MTERRALTIAGGVTAAVAGALAATGLLVLVEPAGDDGGAFPFGGALLVVVSAPVAVVGAVLLGVAWSTGRRSQPRP